MKKIIKLRLRTAFIFYGYGLQKEGDINTITKRKRKKGGWVQLAAATTGSGIAFKKFIIYQRNQPTDNDVDGGLKKRALLRKETYTATSHIKDAVKKKTPMSW